MITASKRTRRGAQHHSGATTHVDTAHSVTLCSPVTLYAWPVT
jgi:hypothetical protein